MTQTKQVVVLVAALDWGLGHAGRIVPVVQELQRQGASVVLAGAGRSGLLLQKECPDLPFEACPPYAIHYAGSSMYLSMLRQLPKIAMAIVREYFWLRRLHRRYHFNAIISDSRFGCFHPAARSVMVAHQLNLQLQPAVLSTLVNWLYRRLLDRFDEIWIPDFPDGLSGQLSSPSPFANTHYLGLLTRMTPNASGRKYDLLVLLSGPEPQRSQLENLVRKQLQDDLPHLSALIVQGKTERSEKELLIGTKTEVVSFLSGTQLLEVMATAEVVLCRSGYSSLMDLARLRKSAILIPTPGQPEQEYLAQRCRDLGWAYVCAQGNLDLSEAIVEVSRKVYWMAPEHEAYVNKMKMVVAGFLRSVRAEK